MNCENTCTCIVCRAGMKWTDDAEKLREAIEKMPKFEMTVITEKEIEEEYKKMPKV